jgi:hypothetical protein
MQFLSFLDTYSSRKLYFSENSLCDVTPVIFAYETKLNILNYSCLPINGFLNVKTELLSLLVCCCFLVVFFVSHMVN